jgi:ketosteroid isomerase-like protein
MTTIAADLLQRHIETLLTPGEWEMLIADDIVWELPFAPALGHPGCLEGREAVEKHINWFRGAVENFRFSDIRVYPLSDPNGAVGEVRAEGRIRASGREYRQEYVFFLRAADGKIVSLREYFDPTRAAKAMDLQIT